MAASEASTELQLKEYESQLDDVLSLLEASPNDDSLLSLKSDLEELISITRQSTSVKNLGLASTLDVAAAQAVSGAAFDDDDDDDDDADVDTKKDAGSQEPPKKKSKSLTEFEVPKHLIALDTDTEAEKNRKRRALKNSKSKWRERKKEVESEQKQKSWQSFQKKKKVKDTSMFSTKDGETKVGVVTASGRHSTSHGERKRHKHAM